MKKKTSILVILIMIFVLTTVGCSNKKIKEINISVAASLEEPIKEIIDNYSEKNSNIKINANFGSSGTLRKQIEEGAEVGIFLSASEAETTKLIEKNIVKEDKVEPFLTTKLLLVKNKDSKENISSIRELNKLEGKIALGAEGVPIGDYSKEALTNSGVWDEIYNNIVFSKDAKAVLNYVNSGEVDYAIVYGNEINSLNNVEVVEAIQDSLHSEIVYTRALVQDEDKEVINFFDYIKENGEVFEKYNFQSLF